MDFTLSEEQVAVQDMARRFADEELAPKAAGIDASEDFDMETYRRMGELGFFSMMMPESVGGAGI